MSLAIVPYEAQAVVHYELGDLVLPDAGGLVLADPRIPPPPGIYPDVPHEVYLDWEAASATRLKQMRRPPSASRTRRPGSRSGC
ncbi:MAG: hypothetical protein GEU90_13420 [Gemmatimonas sp.]|nr:hypothetical protein [Gemmatimonas sp.]